MLGCPPTVTDQTMNQALDTTPPVITITSPLNEAVYPSVVEVKGRVTDLDDKGGTGAVSALSYEVLSLTSSADVTFDTDGNFSFNFQTGSYSGPIVVKVTATDWNGNKADVSRTLKDSDASIAGFTVVPANRKVTINWEDVPFTQQYNLYYTTDGSLPSQVNGSYLTDIQSGYELDNLENGHMHVFLLQAVSTTGAANDNWSDYAYVIPLSRMSLAPRLTGEYNSVKVEWDDIPAITENSGLRFIVYRSTTDTKGINISGSWSGTTFYDRGVTSGQGYYYMVEPYLAGANAVTSYANWGMGGLFPREEEKLIGSINTAGTAYGVAVDGNYAYIADGTNGLVIMDITRPASPRMTGSVKTGGAGEARAVAVKDTYAFVAYGNEGIQVVDISSKTQPTIVASCSTTNAYDIALSGNYAYVADRGLGLRIIDVSSPLSVNNSSLFASWDDAGGEAYAVAVSGNYAYVAHGNGGLWVINIANPAAVNDSSDVGHWDSGTGLSYGVSISGNRAYVAHGLDGIWIIDISTPASVTAGSGIGSYNTPGTAWSVCVKDKIAYVADSNSSNDLLVLNIAAEANPALITTIDLQVNAINVIEYQDFLYIAGQDRGFFIAESRYPVLSNSVTSTTITGTAYDLAVKGNYIFIANGSGGLRVDDLANPGILTNCDTPGSARAIKISGNYAFIADNTTGLQVIDISNPAAITNASLVASCDTPGNAYGIDILGDYAYIADAGSGLQIINISNPVNVNSASLVGSCDTSGSARDLKVTQQYAYLADGSLGISVINISRPDRVTGSSLLTSRTSANTVYANGIDLIGDLLMIADNNVRLDIFSLADPDNPTALVNNFVGSQGLKIKIAGGFTFAVDSTNDILYCLDTSKHGSIGTNPGGSFNVTAANGINVYGGYAYLSDISNGVYRISLSGN